MGAWVVERYWPGVTEADAARMDAALHTLHGGRVRYLGSVLMLGDEVMLVRFEGGTAAEVEAAARQVGLNCDRLVPAIFLS